MTLQWDVACKINLIPNHNQGNQDFLLRTYWVLTVLSYITITLIYKIMSDWQLLGKYYMYLYRLLGSLFMMAKKETLLTKNSSTCDTTVRHSEEGASKPQSRQSRFLATDILYWITLKSLCIYICNEWLPFKYLVVELIPP